MFKRAGIALGVAALVAIGITQPASAASPRTEATVHDFHTFDEIDGATATLTRTANGLSATLSTSLPAGHAETMWWVIFNNPGACTADGRGCSDDDIFAVFGGGPNPAGIAILNADGRVVPPSGGPSPRS